MHVERRRARAEQMIMDGGDLEPARDHLQHDRVNFRLQQHQVAHRHDTAMRGLERDPAAKRECRLDGHAVKRHRPVSATKSLSMDLVRDARLSPKYLLLLSAI